MAYYDVRITRKLGPVDIEVGTTLDLTADHLEGTTASAEIDKALTAVASIIDRYTAEHLAKVQSVQTHAVNETATETTERVEPANAIHKTIYKGKAQYKVHGGCFSQYGVYIWDEVLKANDIEKASIPDEGLTLTDTEMVIEMRGRRPHKVIALRSKSS